MKESNIALLCVFLAGLLAGGGVAGWAGYRIGARQEDAGSPKPGVVSTKAAPEVRRPIEDEPDPFPEISDAEIESMIAETESEPAAPPGFNPEEREARRKRWENMSIEQQRMMRKAMFSALAKVDGLEEVGEAVRKGKIDPRQFKINPEEIADRMEIHAEMMDQESMEQEVTKTLQTIVDQARSQLK